MRFLLGPPVHLYIYTSFFTVQNVHSHTQKAKAIMTRRATKNHYSSALRLRDAMCNYLFLYRNSRNLVLQKGKPTHKIDVRVWSSPALSAPYIQCTHKFKYRRSANFYISMHTHPECSCFFFFVSFDSIKYNSTFSLSAFLSVDSQWILNTHFFFIVSPLVESRLEFFAFTIAKSITFTQTLYYPRCTLWTISYSLRKSTMEKKRERKNTIKFIAKIITPLTQR